MVCIGNTESEACNCFTFDTVWQPQSVYNITSAKYINESNCQSSSCDWDGAWNWVSDENGFAVGEVTNFTCGNISTAVFCGGYSDERLKNGVETLKNSIENIMKIEAVEYDWNENLTEYEYFKNQQKLHTIGLIAQNIRVYYPEVVRINSDGYYSIDYTKLNAVLVEGIKEQSIFIENMDKELDYIESKLN